MIVKTLAGFKKLAIISVALLGFLVIVKWDVQADTYRSGFKTTSNPSRVIVAQNETQTATNEEKAPAPIGTEPESKTDEEKESTSVKKKPLKDFQPSEKIEAEQAVDFPYDI